jgi:hypothetical protein
VIKLDYGKMVNDTRATVHLREERAAKLENNGVLLTAQQRA